MRTVRRTAPFNALDNASLEAASKEAESQGPAKPQSDRLTDEDRVFEAAGELFSLLSTPVRLKVLSALCNGERNVSDLVAATATKQPNLSQHLNALYRSGILAKRRDGTQIFYSILSQRAVQLCRAVCTQVAMDLDDEAHVSSEDRLFPKRRRGI
jgi:DNA-binding transcriptional ArsR family regulator